MHFNTLSAILRGPWLIECGFVQSHLPLIHGIVTGKSNGAELFKGSAEMERPFVYANGQRIDAYKTSWSNDSNSYVTKLNEDAFPDNSIFVIPSIGPVMKYNGDCGEPGNVMRQGWAADFAGSKKLTGLISFLDTPGGQADGTPQYADYIKSIDKPKIAYVDGGAYSAGAWNASAHDQIIISSDFTGFGSVGAYTTIVDYSGYFKKMGLKVTDIYPDESSEKNLPYREAMNGNLDLMKENVAELAKYFISEFGDNRAGKLKNDSWQKGKAFNGKEALSIGLVDGVGSFEDVAASLGAATKTPGKKIISLPGKKAGSSATHQTPPETNMKFPLLTALAGNAAPTQDELSAVNAELTEAGITGVGLYPESLATDAAQVTADLGIAQGEVNRLTTALETVNTSMTAVSAENAVLRARIAKGPAAAAPAAGKKDPEVEETPEQQSAKVIAGLAHNHGLLDNPLFKN